MQPHHLDYSSSNGSVDIFVVPFNLAGGVDEVREMQRMTELLKQGQIPQRFFARSSGAQGLIPLHWWPYGNVKYVVYLRAPATSEVTLTVHYAP